MVLLWKAGQFSACFHRLFSIFLSSLGRIIITHTHRQEVVKRMVLESGLDPRGLTRELLILLPKGQSL